MKKVSIIVPIYKSEYFLPTLIDSMLGQTYNNLEIILVDDESPDNSGKICDEYAQKDDRIVVIHKKNGGCSEARNTALKIVTGDYLTFIDGDDWMEPDCIEYLVKLLEDNDCDMSMVDCLMTTSNRVQNRKDNIRILTPEQAICEIMYVNVPVGAWNKLYKTEIIRKHGINFPISWFGEGLYFSSIAAQFADKVAEGHRKVYGYRKNNPNSGTTVRKVQDGINALEHSKYVRDHLTKVTPRILHSTNWHIWKNCFNLLMFIIGAGEKRSQRELYKSTKKEMRSLFKTVFLHSEVSLKQRVLIVLLSLAPCPMAKVILFMKKEMFKRDLKVKD